jgi:hypothetical protein
MLWGNVVIKQFARANSVILAGHCMAVDPEETEYDLELKKEGKDSKLHRMAKVDNLLEMWQGIQNVCTTEKEYRIQNK